MKRNLVVIYWLVLLVSTLAIGGVAFYFLNRENEHLRDMAADSVQRKGRTVAVSLDLLVDDAKSSLISGLAGLSDNALEAQMIAWRESNPYARSVFLYNPGQGLLLPRPGQPEHDMLQAWLRSGAGWPWGPEATVMRMNFRSNVQSPVNNGALNASLAGTLGQGASATQQSSNAFNPMKAARAGVRDEAKGKVGGNSVSNSFSVNIDATGDISTYMVESNFSQNGIPTLSTDSNGAVYAAVPGGVVTFSQGNLVVVHDGQMTIQAPASFGEQAVQMTFAQTMVPSRAEQGWVHVGGPNDSRWLGWVRPVPGGPVRGVELNWEALREPMKKQFPERLEPGEGFVLLDASGNQVFSRFANDRLAQAAHRGEHPNDPRDSAGIDPIAWLDVGEDLPGWKLVVYYNPQTNFSSGFMLVSTIMVGILLASVVVGGTLLLREARREASDAARKTSFVSNVSHELKTPLTTIRMYAELLGEGRVRDPSKQRNYLATIIGESQRLTRLVNNVLDFSRMDQGRKKYSLENVSLGEVVENVLNAQRPRLQEVGITCETDLPETGDVRAHVDRDALEQVLLNLLDNAIKYAGDGHWIGVRVAKEGSQAVLTVRDHGPGVPPAHREKIFEVFHRVDDSITARQPGTGLGLSIARRLLRDQGGDLRFEPNLPCGSVFIALVPLAAPVVQFDAAARAEA